MAIELEQKDWEDLKDQMTELIRKTKMTLTLGEMEYNRAIKELKKYATSGKANNKD